MDLAPDFTLLSSDQKLVSLSDFRGETVILYFYPKDNTPGCTKQACQFRDDFEQYQSKQAIILGISHDSLAMHQTFISKYNLPFLLLCDVDKKVSSLYGVFKEKSMFGKTFLGIERTTFIINPKGYIQKVFKRVKVDQHSKRILDFLSQTK